MFTHFVGKKAEAVGGTFTESSEVDATNGGQDNLTNVVIVSGLPSGLVEILVMGWDISFDGENETPGIQLGDSGGFEVTGYESCVKSDNLSIRRTAEDGFFTTRETDLDAANSIVVVWKLWRHITSAHRWYCWGASYPTGGSSGRIQVGMKVLSGEITQIQATGDGSVINFDGGTFTARYQ